MILRSLRDEVLDFATVAERIQAPHPALINRPGSLHTDYALCQGLEGESAPLSHIHPRH